MECRVDKPYPKVEVEGKNIAYANLLLQDYAGISGEDTAIHQYIYQKFDKAGIDPEFSETLSKIAMIEMRHLELLGETIKLLGVDPKFKFIENSSNCLTYWSGSFVDYTTDIVSMLQNDILIEEEAIKNYQYHISIIDDKYIKRLLYRIIEDEEQHLRCFHMLLDKVISKNSTC